MLSRFHTPTALLRPSRSLPTFLAARIRKSSSFLRERLLRRLEWTWIAVYLKSDKTKIRISDAQIRLKVGVLFIITENNDLSLTVNNITAVLTNQFSRAKIITINWQNNFNFRLMMTCAQVVETSVTVIDNSPSQDYHHPDDYKTWSTVYLLRICSDLLFCFDYSFLKIYIAMQCRMTVAIM